MNFSIRCASACDVPLMHAVRKSVLENRLALNTRITEASYLPHIAAGSAWVAETDTGIVGFAAVDVQAERIWALFVKPDAEGYGIGRALQTTMLDWAGDQGIARLFLSTEIGSRAMSFYSKAGWTLVSTSDDGEAHFEKALT